jgi:hypothetical protein
MTTENDLVLTLDMDRAPDFVAEHAHRGCGPRSLFLEIVDMLSGKGKRIDDLTGTETT